MTGARPSTGLIEHRRRRDVVGWEPFVGDGKVER
jgi:hypothetical protein